LKAAGLPKPAAFFVRPARPAIQPWGLGFPSTYPAVWSRGDIPGATGVRQIVELFWHLTTRAGRRQVAGARVGLAENSGGTVGGDSEGALSVTIVKV